MKEWLQLEGNQAQESERECGGGGGAGFYRHIYLNRDNLRYIPVYRCVQVSTGVYGDMVGWGTITYNNRVLINLPPLPV